MRAFAILPTLIVCLAMAGPVIAQDASTTRIETRPYYGAVVTIEAGVRVFRPLPPTKKVIINPDGQVPLSLGFNETRVYQKSVNVNVNRNTNVNRNGSSGIAGVGVVGRAFRGGRGGAVRGGRAGGLSMR